MQCLAGLFPLIPGQSRPAFTGITHAYFLCKLQTVEKRRPAVKMLDTLIVGCRPQIRYNFKTPSVGIFPEKLAAAMVVRCVIVIILAISVVGCGKPSSQPQATSQAPLSSLIRNVQVSGPAPSIKWETPGDLLADFDILACSTPDNCIVYAHINCFDAETCQVSSQFSLSSTLDQGIKYFRFDDPTPSSTTHFTVNVARAAWTD